MVIFHSYVNVYQRVFALEVPNTCHCLSLFGVSLKEIFSSCRSKIIDPVRGSNGEGSGRGSKRTGPEVRLLVEISWSCPSLRIAIIQSSWMMNG